MPNEFYWLAGHWPGKLAMAPRPRGGDWLRDEIANWKRAGVTAVLSLLTSAEEQELALDNEETEVKRQGMQFMSLPIADRHVPSSETKFLSALEKVERHLQSGKHVLVHCRQGIGRSGLVAACLLVRKGLSPDAAVQEVSAARGAPIPETPEQRDWIDHYPAALGAK
jgi:protein-tyrosine phosphatase